MKATKQPLLFNDHNEKRASLTKKYIKTGFSTVISSNEFRVTWVRSGDWDGDWVLH